MMRFKYPLITMVVLSTIIMFTSCQKEPTFVEPQESTQPRVSKFSIPEGATFESATFYINVHGPNSLDINLHRITVPWNERNPDGVTWNSFPGGTASFDPVIEGSFNATLGWQSVDVTSLVRSWLDGTNANYGLILDQFDKLFPRARYNSREHVENHPYLEICYTNGGTVCESIEPIGDTYIWGNYPDQNYGLNQWLWTGWPEPTVIEKQTLIMFDIEPTPPEPECETAYAFGDDLATCFLDIPGVKSNNWGWSNGPISDPSSYSWNIYAGAGQCDITKGTLVGTLDVDYSGGTATVAYNIDLDFTLDETHLYVGDEMLPRKEGKFTTAPGQFPYSGQQSYTIDGLSGDIYIVAHSVVCGNFE